jgi:predicted CXXCH cytochrome family protein
MRLTLALITALPLLAAEWAGSRACAPCHERIYETYRRTPMAMSSGVPAGLPTADFRHERSGRYRVERHGEGYSLALATGTRDLAYFIGSGAVARSFAWAVDGFLFQAPVAFYTREAKWALSPGYDRYPQPFLTRPILPGCLECHASFVQRQPRTQNGYGSPPFLEGGVACERCHGPGAAHVASRGKTALVNPVKLDAERRDSVCAQCHLSGEVRVTRAGAGPFVAGERLSDHVAVFVREKSGIQVTSHVENLEQSRCRQVSGGKLWCGTCHDPHTKPQPVAIRAKCMECHQTRKCPTQRADCLTCHMPKSPATDADHVVYTDHAIRRRPAVRAAAPPDARLIAFGQASDRDLGLAYAILAQRGGAAYRSRALALLAPAAATDDAEALLYLANLDSERAVTLYEKAIRLDPAQLTGSVNLGAIRMEQGNYPEAIRLWTDALAKNPSLVLVRQNLAVALRRMGRHSEADAVLAKAGAFR